MSKLTPEQSVDKKKTAQRALHDSNGTTQARKDEFKASVKSVEKEPTDTIDYPEEEINPDDIPF